jgi:hypothetical protein
MRSLLKILLALVVAGALALVGGYLWFRSWLPSEEGAAWLSEKITAEVGRPVRLTGLALPGGLVLEIAGLSVGPVNPGLDPTLELRGTRVGVDAGATWALGKPVLTELVVGGGEIRMPTGAGASPAAPPSPAPAPGAAPPAPSAGGGGAGGDTGPPLLARSIRLGKLRVLRGEAALVELDQLESSLDEQGRLVAKARGHTVGDGTFDLEADVALGGSRPEGTAHLAGSGVAVDGLLAAVAAFTALPPGVRGAGKLEFDASWKRKGSDEEIAAKVRPQDVEVHHPSLRQPLRIPEGTFQITPQELVVDVPLTIGALRAAAKGTWKPPAPAGTIDLALEVERFGVAEVGPLLPEVLEAQVAGRGRGDVEVSARVQGTGAAPQWRVAVVPHGLRLVASGDLPEVDVAGTGLVATPEQVTLDLQLSAGKVALVAGGLLQPPAPDGNLELAVRGAAIPLTAVAGLAGGIPPTLKSIAGKLDLEAIYQGKAQDLGPTSPGLGVSLALSGVAARVPALGGRVDVVKPATLTWEQGKVPEFPLEVRTPAGTLQGTVTPKLDPAAPGATVRWSIPALKPSALAAAAPPGTLKVAGRLQASGGNVLVEDLTAQGKLQVAGAAQPLQAKVSKVSLQGGALVVEGASLTGPGVQAAGGVSFPPGQDPKLDLKATVELAKVPVALPAGMKLHGKVAGQLAYQGPWKTLAEQALPLRFEGVSLEAPGAPRVSWKSGAVRVSKAGVVIPEARVGIGPDLEIALQGEVGPALTKVTGEFAGWSLGQLAALAPGKVPAGLELGGAVGGRVFYQGPLPSSAAAAGAGLAVRVQPKDVFVRVPWEGGAPVVLRLGNEDLVLKKGRFDLSQIALGTPAGKVVLKGELQPLSGKLPAQLAFSAPRMEGFQGLLPPGAKVTGFAALDGRLKPMGGGGVAIEARLRPRGLRATMAGSENAFELRTGTLQAFAKHDATNGLRAMVKGDGVQVLFGTLKQPLVWAGGAVRVDPAGGSLQDMELKLGKGTALRVAGAVKNQSFLGTSVAGVLDLKDIQPAFGIEASRQLVGKVRVVADVVGTLEKFQVQGGMAAPDGVAVVFLPQGGGKPFPIPLLNVVVPFTFQGTDLEIRGAKARLYGGTLDLDGGFHFDQTPFRMAQTCRLTDIQLHEFSAQSLQIPGAFAGTLRTAIQVTGRGSDPAELTILGDEGSVTGFTLDGAVLGNTLGLTQFLNPVEAAAAKPNAGWKDILKGLVVEKVVQEVDALAEYREHLRSLLAPHHYPDVVFKIEGPKGFSGGYLRTRDDPELFSAIARFNLSTLDLAAQLQSMTFRYKDDCRLQARDIKIGGKVNAPVLEDTDFWKRLEQRCPPAPAPPAPAPAPPAPPPAPPPGG